MASKRYVIVHTADGKSGDVIDVIHADQDEGSPNREILIDTGTHRFVESDEADPAGWTWTKRGGLKAG